MATVEEKAQIQNEDKISTQKRADISSYIGNKKEYETEEN